MFTPEELAQERSEWVALLQQHPFNAVDIVRSDAVSWSSWGTRETSDDKSGFPKSPVMEEVQNSGSKVLKPQNVLVVIHVAGQEIRETDFIHAYYVGSKRQYAQEKAPMPYPQHDPLYWLVFLGERTEFEPDLS